MMLKGKTALITGSVIGIGNATARAFAAQGVNIMLNGLGEPDNIERVRAGMEAEYGVTVKYHGADLAQRDQTEDLAKSTQDQFGSLDILVNNAVIRYYDDIVDFDPKNWDHAMAVNVTAPFDLTRCALPGMRKKGWGRIVNMSSIMGLAARSGRADYITSKTAIIGITRATAAETLRDPNITCNAISPGSVLTDFINARLALRRWPSAIGRILVRSRISFNPNRLRMRCSISAATNPVTSLEPYYRLTVVWSRPGSRTRTISRMM
jgi:3-hydroxybutyrate dehydrogenase